MLGTKTPHKKYLITTTEGDIAISPGSDVSNVSYNTNRIKTVGHPNKNTELLMACLEPRLKSTTARKELIIRVGSQLHVLDNYAYIKVGSQPNTKIPVFTFDSISDGMQAYELGLRRSNAWEARYINSICNAALETLKKVNPAVTDDTEQHIEVYSGNGSEVYGELMNIKTKRTTELTIRIHRWDALWKNQNELFIDRLAKLIRYFNNSQLLLSTLKSSQLDAAWIGTGLSSIFLEQIQPSIDAKQLAPFNSEQITYLAQALGLDRYALLASVNNAQDLSDTESLFVYAHLFQAAFHYFKSKSLSMLATYREAGITDEQIRKIFTANLMFIIAEAASFTFFPSHILYGTPCSEDGIQRHIGAISARVFNKPLTFPVQFAEIPPQAPVSTTSLIAATMHRTALAQERVYKFLDKKIDSDALTEDDLLVASYALNALKRAKSKSPPASESGSDEDLNGSQLPSQPSSSNSSLTSNGGTYMGSSGSASSSSKDNSFSNNSSV